MILNEAILELQALAAQQGQPAERGSTTTNGSRKQFESVMQIEDGDEGPVQAWINTTDRKQSCAIHFVRGGGKISFGPKPFRGNRSRVRSVTLPLAATK